jgi:hypothetical protein
MQEWSGYFLGNYIKEEGCFIWLKGKDRDGYGRAWFNKSTLPAHRVSYYLYYKVWPGDKLVCHSCDNPSCVNPNHMFLGTHRDNHKDRGRKGRTAKLDNHGRAKLNVEKAKEIRKLYSAGYTQRELGDMFNVSNAAVHSIVNNKTWRV